MKNVFYAILLFAGICSVLSMSCTGGDYNASPGSNANYVVNPSTPLTQAQFNWSEGATPALWSGTGVMGGVINGVSWATNNAFWIDTSGPNELYGVLGAQVIHLHLNSVYGGNIYPMSFHQYNQNGTWSDSVSGSYNVYQSINGNSGEVYITENDSAYIKGMFYFEGITSTGQIAAINSGYFNISKP